MVGDDRAHKIMNGRMFAICETLYVILKFLARAGYYFRNVASTVPTKVVLVYNYT